MVAYKFIQNSVHFQYKCSILSLNDKMTKNARETDFLDKILTDFVCIFSLTLIFNQILAS